LFLALGVAVASALQAVHLVVAENGFISLNVPLTFTRLGSLSTRTTHPHFIATLSEILQAVGIDVRLELPYRFKTKGEMLTETKNPGLLAVAAPLTMSCSHPEVGRYRGTTPGQHCGYCVPCIIRRAALEKAGLAAGAFDFDIVAQPPEPTTKKATDLRAFGMALERFRIMPPRARAAAVLSTGPLPASDMDAFVAMYARGMQEIAALLTPGYHL
jgi:hypothetical protein